jgi:hypothetical protein
VPRIGGAFLLGGGAPYLFMTVTVTVRAGTREGHQKAAGAHKSVVTHAECDRSEIEAQLHNNPMTAR